MNAYDCYEFLEWFEKLPTPESSFGESIEVLELIPVGEHMQSRLRVCTQLRLIERFDWLSTEMFELMEDSIAFSNGDRVAKRNEILRLATARRLANTENRSRIFRSRRAKWEHDAEQSRLEKQTEELAQAHSKRVSTFENLTNRRRTFLATLAQLRYATPIRTCSAGAFRRTDLGDFVWQRLRRHRLEQTRGWSLAEMLTIGHLVKGQGQSR